VALVLEPLADAQLVLSGAEKLGLLMPDVSLHALSSISRLTVVLGVESMWKDVGGGTDPTPAAPRFIPAFF
jgi:hypothetical protein